MPEVKIIPDVQKIMRLQSDDKRLGILVALYPDRKLSLHELHELMEVHNSTLHFVEAELMGNGLANSLRGKLELTDMGRLSVDAFQEYRVRLLPQMISVRLEQTGKHFGPETVQVEQIYHLPESYRPEPALLRVMRIYGDGTRTTILQILSASQGDFLPFRTVLQETEDGLHKRIPASTLSNVLTEFERGLLVERKVSGSAKLTPLGNESLQAFYTYQDRLREAVIRFNRQKLQADFGGLIL